MKSLQFGSAFTTLGLLAITSPAAMAACPPSPPIPTCAVGCTKNISLLDPVTTVVINAGDVVCAIDTQFKDITLNGGELRVCDGASLHANSFVHHNLAPATINLVGPQAYFTTPGQGTTRIEGDLTINNYGQFWFYNDLQIPATSMNNHIYNHASLHFHKGGRIDLSGTTIYGYSDPTFNSGWYPGPNTLIDSYNNVPLYITGNRADAFCMENGTNNNFRAPISVANNDIFSTGATGQTCVQAKGGLTVSGVTSLATDPLRVCIPSSATLTPANTNPWLGGANIQTNCNTFCSPATLPVVTSAAQPNGGATAIEIYPSGDSRYLNLQVNQKDLARGASITITNVIGQTLFKNPSLNPDERSVQIPEQASGSIVYVQIQLKDRSVIRTKVRL